MNPHPLALALTAVALAAPLTLGSLPALAQISEAGEDVERIQTVKLEDKIPPVSGRIFFKQRRFELSPTVDFSFGDAFFQKIGVGLKGDYHFLETLSVTAHFLYNFNLTSSSVSVCDVDGACGSPEVDSLTNVPGKLGLMAGLGVAWTPLYGKLSLMAEKVLHFDFGLTLGGGVIQYMAPENSEFEGVNKFAPTGHVGLLFRLVFTDSIAMRFELKDYIYSGATVQLGNSTSKIENQIMFEIGLSFFLGAGSED
jgi:outer membrane beta-barrel protein